MPLHGSGLEWHPPIPASVPGPALPESSAAANCVQAH